MIFADDMFPVGLSRYSYLGGGDEQKGQEVINPFMFGTLMVS